MSDSDQERIGVVEGDPAENSVGVSKITIDRLIKTEFPADCIALYVFYAYTARWQKVSAAHCTTSFAAKGLGWSDDRIRRTKGILKGLGLVSDIKDRDNETGVVKGWYVKVNYLARFAPQSTLHENPEGGKTHSVDNPTVRQSPPPGESGDKCSRTSNSNALELVTNGNAAKKSNGRLPTSEEAIRICKIFSRRLTTVWSKKEIIAFRELIPFEMGDLAIVEKYYSYQQSLPDGGIARRDLCTFLNNYLGEVDRAKQWIGKKPHINGNGPQTKLRTSHELNGA